MIGWALFAVYVLSMAGLALWMQWRDGDDTTFAEFQGMLLGAWFVLPFYALGRGWKWLTRADDRVILRGRKAPGQEKR